MARCSGPKGPTPATPPFDRSQGLRSLRLRSCPRDLRRATGAPQISRAHAGRARRNVPPAPFAGLGLSPQRAGTLGINLPPRPLWLTSPRPSDDTQSSSLCGDARYGFRCTESSCPLRGETGRARRRFRQGPAEPLRGRSRQGPSARRSGIAPATREPCLGHSRAKAKSPPDGPAGSPRRRRAVLAPSVRGHCPWPRARARRRSSWPPQCRAA